MTNVTTFNETLARNKSMRQINRDPKHLAGELRQGKFLTLWDFENSRIPQEEVLGLLVTPQRGLRELLLAQGFATESHFW